MHEIGQTKISSLLASTQDGAMCGVYGNLTLSTNPPTFTASNWGGGAARRLKVKAVFLSISAFLHYACVLIHKKIRTCMHASHGWRSGYARADWIKDSWRCLMLSHSFSFSTLLLSHRRNIPWASSPCPHPLYL